MSLSPNQISPREVLFDHLSNSESCGNTSYLFFSTSRLACRPISDGTSVLLRYSQLIYLDADDYQIIDPGIQIRMWGCPLFFSLSPLSNSSFSVETIHDLQLGAVHDILVTVRSCSQEAVIIAPEEPLCRLSFSTRCSCNSNPGSLPRSIDYLPLNNSNNGHLHVSVLAVRFVDFTRPNVPVERIYRWLYSDYPFIRRMTIYSASTGIKSAEVAGVFEFYRNLYRLTGYCCLNVYTDVPGVHDLFTRYSQDPSVVPSRYRSYFQREPFIETYREIPIVVKNNSSGGDFIRASYRAFLNRWSVIISQHNFLLVDPSISLFSELVYSEFSNLTMRPVTRSD